MADDATLAIKELQKRRIKAIKAGEDISLFDDQIKEIRIKIAREFGAEFWAKKPIFSGGCLVSPEGNLLEAGDSAIPSDIKGTLLPPIVNRLTGIPKLDEKVYSLADWSFKTEESRRFWVEELRKLETRIKETQQESNIDSLENIDNFINWLMLPRKLSRS